MPSGKLTLCLGVAEGCSLVQRTLVEAMRHANTPYYHILLIDFEPHVQGKIVESLYNHDCGYTFLSSSNKFHFDKILPTVHPNLVFVFNQLASETEDAQRYKYMIQLIHSGVNVYTYSSLRYFQSCKNSVKKVLKPQSNKLFVNENFFKYIDQVIVINNFDDIPQADFCTNADSSQVQNKDTKAHLHETALTLAMHINHQNKHFSDDERTSLFTKQSKPFAIGSGRVINFIKKASITFSQALWRECFSISNALANVVLCYLLAIVFLPLQVQDPKTLIIVNFVALLLNVTTYSLFANVAGIVSMAGLAYLSMEVTHESLSFFSIYFKVSLLLVVLLLILVTQNNNILFASKKYIDSNEERFALLSDFSQELTAATNLEQLYSISKGFFAAVFSKKIILIVQDQNLPSAQTLINEDGIKTITATSNMNIVAPEINEYELKPLTIDTVELGWIGCKNSPKNNELDSQLLNAAILQLSITLQRYHLARSYQTAVLRTEKEELRSFILSSISHDLKTPLTTIIGSCTALEELDGLSEKNRMILVRTIHEASEQLNQFISNILDSTRLNTDQIFQQSAPVYLDDVINVVLQKVKKLLRLFDVSVKVENPEEAVVMADFTLIQQVLYNLVENATKYTPIGGKIAISVFTITDSVFVKVIDNGPGIIESKRKLIFDKFYRFQHKDQQKAGTGLGLSICKQIIEAYHGKIWVSDRDDGQKGSQFNIELPLGISQQKLIRRQKGS